MAVILKAENISKQYRLGVVGASTLGHDLKRWWYTLQGKDDPFLKVGGVNDRSSKAVNDYIWALKDINFEVKQGEVLGIIGKNGAGKSTLLKILSRVTAPTTGTIRTRGRIASLLEVGTGFHPELTGRENIFMNGTVLGMTKNEIKGKLDEIISFSGCRQYIDTPVKRYSSGMTVRLGFAVAAHLEPEILVVDEVLAVGDAEFQKKAISKMQELSSGEGRTVLFVSHNMASIQTLCSRAILLDNGTITESGFTSHVLNEYLKNRNKKAEYKVKPRSFEVQIQHKEIFDNKENIVLELTINSENSVEKPVFIDFAVINNLEEFVVHYRMNYNNEKVELKKGVNKITFTIQNPRLIMGEYSTIVYIYDQMKNVLCWIENASFLRVLNSKDDIKSFAPLKSDIMHEVNVKVNQ